MIGYGIAALVFLIVVTRLVKAWNAPKVAAAEAEALRIKTEAQDAKRDDVAAKRESKQEAKQAKREGKNEVPSTEKGA